MAEKFETKMKKLESIVDKLERNEIDLDESIKLYEEGLKLSNDLKAELKKFEEKIEQISGE